MRFLDRVLPHLGRAEAVLSAIQGQRPRNGRHPFAPRADSVPHPLAALAHGKRLVIAPVARLHTVHAVEIQGRRQPIGLQQE